MKLALGQIDPVIGDINGNAAKIIALLDEGKGEQVELFIFPELAITGYPPEDLLLKPQFVADNLAALKTIAKNCRGTAVYLGFVDRQGKALYNAGAFIVDGKIRAVYHKNNLPNYAVFDEKRYFTPGKKSVTVAYRGQKIGLGICEDLWVDKGPYKKGLDLVLNINASPYHLGKIRERQKILAAKAKKLNSPIVYVNQIGGQDELVFDGGSMVVDRRGRLIAACDQYREELLIFDLKKERQKNIAWLAEELEIYGALVLGTKDYVLKNGFQKVLIGLSGGIDSALTLAVAVDALGKDKVQAVYMPSRYSAEQSYQDAKQTADNLGVPLAVISIEEVFSSYLKVLQPHFRGLKENVAEENLQARIRGNYLMALANKFNWLVLTTGNKSEMSTGYCTLYGDMAGGFAVLKDVSKTLVYRLARWRNKQGEVIPSSTIDRAPTAELKADQTDQDTLPPYELLDEIIALYVEQNKGKKEIVSAGYDEAMVCQVLKMIDAAEYKRRQAPPGPRITPRAFGKDWRPPITNRYNIA